MKRENRSSTPGQRRPARAGGDEKPASAHSRYLENPVISRLPNHLKQFIIDQNYDGYTPIDHAVWRYVMRQNYNFLKDNAHAAYVDGLRRTGIGIEAIPSIDTMNDILGTIGWAAVTVDGFIPPAAFMEYQAYRVLVIAADMRQINHIEYTPAPDIIHEAAGHAPIIADAEYAEYLRQIGYVGARAMSSKKDYELYEAIRHLSILKERSDADPEEIAQAERDVEYKQNNLGEPSEMARLSRLHWWTVEFGLIGDLDNPKIYGAGLLSSIGESANCLKRSVKKIPYSIATADYPFDITTQQPHLFVTPSFQHLLAVLEEFSQSMAYRVGGAAGLSKAVDCANVCSAQLSSGLQVTGVFTELLTDPHGRPIYFRTNGPSALAVDGRQLDGHGRDYHLDGFSSPVGRLKGIVTPPEKMTDSDLYAHGIGTGGQVGLQFESGIEVSGRLDRIVRHNGNLLLLSLANCTVRLRDRILFRPEWGRYDLAVGEAIVSVFSGAADKDAYDQVPLVPKERTVKAATDKHTLSLQGLYQKVRDTRAGRSTRETLLDVWRQVRNDYDGEWLLPLELLEILQEHSFDPQMESDIKVYLENLARTNSGLTKLIHNGLSLIYR
ncbi:MAG TPA: aromatic amino acid hydroxylase [Candidatus Deferrimicrobium sp.]|nr:aromatic amino acid hydroxylase [Candidatus Deferrimicrobium sp.]